jgi:hypothetical protein
MFLILKHAKIQKKDSFRYALNQIKKEKEKKEKLN